MSLDLPALRQAVAAHGAVIRVLVLRTAGSVPREAGTAMLVWDGGQDGTIGGGTLEWEAIRAARAMLAEAAPRAVRTLPLGPALGQCCGGSVTLLWERFDPQNLPAGLPFARAIAPMARTPAVAAALAAWRPGQPPQDIAGWLVEGPPLPRRPLWIWGAGHVGRALVQVLSPLPEWEITWADIGPDRFPEAPEVTAIPAADLPRLAAHVPADAGHLIVTLSHDTDLALCHALLNRGFAACGLIGSATKWARFRTRLRLLGHDEARISRIACPIGDPALGKHPQAIAVGVAAALLKQGRVARNEAAAGEIRTG